MEKEWKKHISITSAEGKKKEIKSKSASKIMTDYACYLFYSFSLSPFSSFFCMICVDLAENIPAHRFGCWIREPSKANAQKHLTRYNTSFSEAEVL